MVRIALLVAVGTVVSFLSSEGMAQRWEEYQVERAQIINRTNRQMRNSAMVSRSMQRSLNSLQNSFQPRTTWQPWGTHNHNGAQWNQQKTNYYYGSQPSTVYWKQNTWGQPTVTYYRW